MSICRTATTFTVTPVAATSLASTRRSVSCAIFDVAYALALAGAEIVVDDVTATIRPHPRSTMPGTTARTTCMVDQRCWSSMKPRSLGSSSATGLPGMNPPMRWRSASIRPQRRWTRSTAGATWSGWRRSAVALTHRSSPISASAATEASRVESRPIRPSRHPSLANARAVARPSAPAAPVIRATRSSPGIAAAYRRTRKRPRAEPGGADRGAPSASRERNVSG